MNINEKLIKLYSDNLNGIQAISDTFFATEDDGKEYSTLDGPLLMHCWEDEYEKAAFKILFIGQEHSATFCWAVNEIEKPLEKYKEFSLAKSYDSPFWRGVKQFNVSLNTENNKLGFLWTNVSKYSTWEGKSITFGDHKRIIEILNLLPKEIDIVKPDVILFLSGPSYDERIKVQFGGNIEFEQLSEGIPKRELARLRHPLIPENTKAFRTYHPNALQRQHKWNYLNLILADVQLNKTQDKHIENSDLNSIINKFISETQDMAETCEVTMQDVSGFGQAYSGLYFWMPCWKYCVIGFQFESNGFGDFFYGICKKDKGIAIPNNIREEIANRLNDQDGNSDSWPYWKWFENRNWDIKTFEEIKSGILKTKMITIIEMLLKKLDGLGL